MKKIYNLFLMTAIVFGMVACSSDDITVPNDNDAKANTYVSVTLKLSSNPGTRAGLPKDYNYVGDWAGQDKIEKVNIYLIDGNSVSKSQDFTVGNHYSAQTNTAGEVILTPTIEAAIQTTSGPKKVYVLINGTETVTTKLASATTPSDFEKVYSSLASGALELPNSETPTVATSASKVASASGTEKYDNIVMTNVSEVTINVAPNVTKEKTIGTEALNRASVNVERAVARVMVTTQLEEYTIGTLGTISNVTWVLAQGEKSLFIQRKADWKTPAHDWVSTTANYISEADSIYDYSGLFENKTAENFGGTTVPTLETYTALSGATAEAQAATLDSLKLDANAVNGKFILPTTHEYAPAPATDAVYGGGYRKGNTPYVLVRAKFTPKTIADGGSLTEDGTFYLGANGKFYTTAANAIDPTNGGVAGQTVAKYEKGKVLYYAWVNPDNVAKPYNSPVLRNNIYHIHITGFKNLGTNWNPLYPESPDAEDPKNPDPKPMVEGVDEPTNPIDPNDPLTTPETWMSVDVKVLPWKVHSYSVELGM